MRCGLRRCIALQRLRWQGAGRERSSPIDIDGPSAGNGCEVGRFYHIFTIGRDQADRLRGEDKGLGPYCKRKKTCYNTITLPVLAR